MLNLTFEPFPILETEDFILRKLGFSDAEAILKLRTNPETMKYIPRPLLKNKEEAIEHIQSIATVLENKEGINWAISKRNNPDMIGIIGFYRIQPENNRAEIGYILLPEFHGKGILTHLVKEVVGYGFKEMKLHSINAVIDPDNRASARVLEKNNFLKEGHLRDNVFFEGRYIDSVLYSLLITDLF